MDPLVLGALVAVFTILVLFSGVSVAAGLLIVSAGFLIVFDGFGSMELLPEIFFGKLEEVRGILDAYPEMAPFLPLKIAVIAEKDETLITVLDPRALGSLYGGAPALRVQFARWYNDLRAMLEELRTYKK